MGRSVLHPPLAIRSHHDASVRVWYQQDPGGSQDFRHYPTVMRPPHCSVGSEVTTQAVVMSYSQPSQPGSREVNEDFLGKPAVTKTPSTNMTEILELSEEDFRPDFNKQLSAHLKRVKNRKHQQKNKIKSTEKN